MTTISAIIGANFGDEGKGCLVNKLSKPDTLIVRYNGGAQAGHTVKLPGGKKHVFSHFGSGSFQGAATYLSQYFVVNPLLFAKEHLRLRDKGVSPRVFVNMDAPVTLPYDMMLNQSLENKRGDGRHGSCGIGFHETLYRNKIPLCALKVEDLLYIEDHIPRIKFMIEEWFEGRVDELELRHDTKMLEWLHSEDIFKHWLADVKYFKEHIEIVSDNIIGVQKHIIFEGAQGLAISKDHRFFPHVTDSFTGLTNIIQLLESAGVNNSINVYYVTRPYFTRHGAGPLPYEETELAYNIIDETNVSNAWQGSLRYSYLDIDFLKESVQGDIDRAYLTHTCPPLNCTLAMSCTNHIKEDGIVHYRHGNHKDGLLKQDPMQYFLNTVLPRNLGMPVITYKECE